MDQMRENIINPQINQELESRLTELSLVVDSYNPTREYLLGAMILSLNAISLIVIMEVGAVLGIILLGVGLLPLIYMVCSSNNNLPTERDLAERACALMSSCINLRKYPGDDPCSISSRMILNYSSTKNLPLYQEFVTLFPHMASKKLKKLSKVNLMKYKTP